MASRPMSNNAECAFDGDSVYVTWEQSRMVGDISREPKVGLVVMVEVHATPIHDWDGEDDGEVAASPAALV